MTTRPYLWLVLVAASACSNAEAPVSQAFSEWAQVVDSARVPADRVASCTPAGEIVRTYASEELSRVLDAKILPDGEVAVADVLQHSILIFSDGAPPRRIGRQGGGPGEFEFLRGLFLASDTLLAWDMRALRVSALSAQGDLFWTRRLDASYPGDWSGSFKGRTRSGHYPLLASVSSSAGIEGAFRDTTDLLIARPDSALIVGARFPSSHQFSAREGRGWRSHEQIFSPDIHLTVAGGTAWIGDSSTGELVSLGPGGEPVRLLQLELTPRRVTPEMVEAERRTMASIGEGTALESSADQIPAFETLPVFEVLRSGSDGRLIMPEYSAQMDEEFRTWIIDPLSLDSRCITLPTGSRLLDARGSRVVVETRDKLGVPTLELRSIGPVT